MTTILNGKNLFSTFMLFLNFPIPKIRAEVEEKQPKLLSFEIPEEEILTSEELFLSDEK